MKYKHSCLVKCKTLLRPKKCMGTCKCLSNCRWSLKISPNFLTYVRGIFSYQHPQTSWAISSIIVKKHKLRTYIRLLVPLFLACVSWCDCSSRLYLLLDSRESSGTFLISPESRQKIQIDIMFQSSKIVQCSPLLVPKLSSGICYTTGMQCNDVAVRDSTSKLMKSKTFT